MPADAAAATPDTNAANPPPGAPAGAAAASTPAAPAAGARAQEAAVLDEVASLKGRLATLEGHPIFAPPAADDGEEGDPAPRSCWLHPWGGCADYDCPVNAS